MIELALLVKDFFILYFPIYCLHNYIFDQVSWKVAIAYLLIGNYLWDYIEWWIWWSSAGFVLLIESRLSD